jgi:hypothetical protein
MACASFRLAKTLHIKVRSIIQAFALHNSMLIEIQEGNGIAECATMLELLILLNDPHTSFNLAGDTLY